MRCYIHNYEYDFLIGKCPHCEAQEREERRLQSEQEAEERSERLAEEAEERQTERDREAEERAQEREWREQERQVEAEAARERAEERRREGQEELLERQREQLANKWRYEAESKLAQARQFYGAGVYSQAIGLASQATVLGMEAYELLGSIEKARGNGKAYSDSLATQLKLLATCSGGHELATHQRRILEAILELPDAQSKRLRAPV